VAAGSGGEDIADGAAGDAALAQPMGLAASPGGEHLYFVDAESSAVRLFVPDDRRSGRAIGEVQTIVGTGLFDFGNVDGQGDAVRLEHPQGIAAAPGGRLYVADSYNDSIRIVDPATRRVDTLVRGLHEPGGLAFDQAGERLYVADTNAHRVVSVGLRSGEITQLVIRESFSRQ